MKNKIKKTLKYVIISLNIISVILLSLFLGLKKEKIVTQYSVTKEVILVEKDTSDLENKIKELEEILYGASLIQKNFTRQSFPIIDSDWDNEAFSITTSNDIKDFEKVKDEFKEISISFNYWIERNGTTYKYTGKKEQSLKIVEGLNEISLPNSQATLLIMYKKGEGLSLMSNIKQKNIYVIINKISYKAENN